jgi:hypothetical protein
MWATLNEEGLPPLHRTHPFVAVLCKLALHPYHGLEAGVEIWHAEIEQLR